MKPEDTRVRQSQLVSTFGVGAIFPSGDHSYLICGLDEWDDRRCTPIEEPRLARSLGVSLFRAPSTGARRGDVPVVRFPEFQYCPECRRLARYWEFDAQKMQCQECIRELTPSRFVACCENGHLEEFPYFQWVHRRVEGAVTWDESAEHSLRLETRGTSSSLGDIVIRCSCGVPPRDLEGAFGRNAVAMVKGCSGRRPWLPGSEPEACDKNLRALQRGSANVWFASVRSSISIPPWSSPSARLVTKLWDSFEVLDDVAVRTVVEAQAAKNRDVDVESAMALVAQRRGVIAGPPPTEAELRAEEYQALVDGNHGGRQDSFQCVAVDVSPSLSWILAQVSKVTRLREVRALSGFSRVTPVATEQGPSAGLSLRRHDWLPAVEIFGEGVFVRLDEGLVADWESGSEANDRRTMLATAIQARDSDTGSNVEAPSTRFLAVHTLAHAVLKELSLDAGYPVGALRERIYAEKEQAGFLVYTASSDAAGSLGGLAALADQERMAEILRNAVTRARWCSNDPVCSESGPSGSDGLNLAACHACLLLPETSCEHRNIFLDRVAMVGVDGEATTGMLSGM
ncbi:protein of unknown function [Nocardioides exalbidus]|uniref:MrfA-like Zn-binding domain-containing protein n=1 Tax=Nocardioides exalbidus TaxID=402596 RepID=A0A1H4KPS4_9ACTN|nr:DUF1998 domain-containing protein [Nocardioides exalbidus]SEB60520.1 protein of unknown function [Nocardioides exalbidus]